MQDFSRLFDYKAMPIMAKSYLIRPWRKARKVGQTEEMLECIGCGSALTGRQSKYCSRRCKNANSNSRHQSYLAQQRRGSRRKAELVRSKGGKCQCCGYGQNLAALQFHHICSAGKAFQLDIRSLSNRSSRSIHSEAEKCILLCANCHAEIHNPQFSICD